MAHIPLTLHISRTILLLSILLFLFLPIVFLPSLHSFSLPLSLSLPPSPYQEKHQKFVYFMYCDSRQKQYRHIASHSRNKPKKTNFLIIIGQSVCPVPRNIIKPIRNNSSCHIISPHLQAEMKTSSNEVNAS